MLVLRSWTTSVRPSRMMKTMSSLPIRAKSRTMTGWVSRIRTLPSYQPRPIASMAMSYCRRRNTYGMKLMHGAVLTEWDSDDEYDATVLGPVPNGHQWGYCEYCHQPFRWDV